MTLIKTILIADRNPRILAFLKRELNSEGYCTHTVENSKQLRQWIHNHPTCDLFIIDPDLFSDVGLYDVLFTCRRMTALPIILHGLPDDYPPHWNALNPIRFIAKSGTSIEELKKVIGAWRRTPA
ncbi:MAG: hypothetical protein VR64_17785 [Desulfatitalea sp. BRH_c12]|nr:MAG: hypothetical protein VR64_17785 [Desulfatitalea sp. BRH_c12]